MTSNNLFIDFKNVSLIYNLFYDKTTTLKEFCVNIFHRRSHLGRQDEKLHALKNLTLRIGHGERVGVIGLNGSGKTTLLRVIAGLLEPSAGQLEIRGSVQPLIEIGAGFNPELSGRENIYLNGAMLGFCKREIQAKEQDIINYTELEHFIDLPVKYYSSGMTLRLAFTIATMIHPEILIMDEMISAGDLEFIQKAKERMDYILSSAKILILVSHDMGLISSLTQRVLVLNKGGILYDGNTSDGIDFYQTMVSNRIEQKQEILRLQEEKRKNEDLLKYQAKESLRRQEDLKKNIVINDVLIDNILHSGQGVYPGDDVRFSVFFETTVEYEIFYVNLHLRNITNTDVAHLRNDYSDVNINDLKRGKYRVDINLKSIPFRSNPYRVIFRLVGINQGEQVVVDSPVNPFEILGDLKKDVLIKNEWRINNID